MARHGSERSLHTMTPHPGQGSRAPTTSPTSAGSPRPFPGTPLLSPSTNGSSHVSAVGTPTGVTSPPAGDSRIPRPSPTALRRSASMRVRGERIVPHLRHSSASTTLHQHHQQRHGHLLKQHHQQSQHHHQQIVEPFPVITENGVDSHRHRSFVSRNFFLIFRLLPNPTFFSFCYFERKKKRCNSHLEPRTGRNQFFGIILF